jgi:hypothetical protein
MRLLYLPWSQLTPEEQVSAIREARRRGALGARGDLKRYQMDHGEPVPIGRAMLYVQHLLPMTPEPWHRDWRRRTVAELCEDPRVCAFCDAWERTRRSLLGKPPLPADAPALALRVREAAEEWAAARRDYRERTEALTRSGGLPLKHRDRLAAGEALVRAIRRREEYWLAVMLARAAGCEPHLGAGSD